MHTTNERQTPPWQNPWWLAGMFCLAAAGALLWQAEQIDNDAERSVTALLEQIEHPRSEIVVPAGPLDSASAD